MPGVNLKMGLSAPFGTMPKANLEEKRKLLKEKAVRAGSDNKETLAFAVQLAQEKIAQLESNRMQAESELDRLQAEIDVRKMLEKPEPKDVDLEVKARVLVKYVATLKKKIEAQQEQAKGPAANTIDLQNDENELAVLSDTARKVKAEVEAMQIELTAPDRIEKVDEARPPKNASWPW